MKKELVIDYVIDHFYGKATTDFLIGYQFRKIQEWEGEDPLLPPLTAFESHLPRIKSFWYMQLLGRPLTPGQRPFDLIGVHKRLHMKVGELGRWVLLFKESLSEGRQKYPDHESLFLNWENKIELFKGKFLKAPGLFLP